MRFKVFLSFFSTLALTHSAPSAYDGFPILAPGGVAGIFKGPDSETIIRGPDGSEITSEEKGGAVVRDEPGLKPIIVAEPELALAPAPIPIITKEEIIPGPIISSTGAPLLASAAPALEVAAPIINEETYVSSVSAAPLIAAEAPVALPIAPIEAKPIEIIEQDPHIVETEIIDAPDVEPDQSSDLKGASGRIITKGSASVVSGPASTTITEPRKILFAPPKIAVGTPVLATATIPLKEAPLVAPLPAITASTIAPPVPIALESSTLAPPVLSYSSTVAPLQQGYPSTALPLGGISSTVDSTNINLGNIADTRQYIPVVEYSSSNGVINEPGIESIGAYSSTEAPIALSSITTTISVDKYAPPNGPVIPPAYNLVPPEPPQTFQTVPKAVGLGSSTASPYIQKIPRYDDNIAIDGKVDLGYSPYYGKPLFRPYFLPQVLGMALSRFYRKTASDIEKENSIIIDDKMGDLSQNEIVYENRKFLPPPDLSQAKYIAPALAKNGIEASQVNLAQIPLSQVTGLPNKPYGSPKAFGYYGNRFERGIPRKRGY